MLKERLDPCATLLYHWIRCHETDTGSFDLNLENFQVWTAEFLEEAASLKEVDHALLRLMQLQLIRVETQGIMTVPLTHQPTVKLDPLPKQFWKMFHWEQRLTTGGLAIAAAMLLITTGLLISRSAQQHIKKQPLNSSPSQLLEPSK